MMEQQQQQQQQQQQKGYATPPMELSHLATENVILFQRIIWADSLKMFI